MILPNTWTTQQKTKSCQILFLEKKNLFSLTYSAEDVKTLSLPGNYHEKISHLGSSLHKFVRLKELDLARNALVSLDGLECLSSLEKLNLYYNNIGSMRELEKLRYNTSLVELDLRLNPITKEENDYRLFLISVLPALKVLDDRAIREPERQMAVAYFRQIHGEEQTIGYTQQQHSKDGYETSSAIAARVKSVANIAKRSAGNIAIRFLYKEHAVMIVLSLKK